MKLQFKFRREVPQAARRELARSLSAQGAKSVRRLFSQSTDPELASLYLVEVEEGKAGQDLLELLVTQKEVEFAEPEVRRKLSR